MTNASADSVEMFVAIPWTADAGTLTGQRVEATRSAERLLHRARIRAGAARTDEIHVRRVRPDPVRHLTREDGIVRAWNAERAFEQKGRLACPCFDERPMLGAEPQNVPTVGEEGNQHRPRSDCHGTKDAVHIGSFLCGLIVNAANRSSAPIR